MVPFLNGIKFLLVAACFAALGAGIYAMLGHAIVLPLLPRMIAFCFVGCVGYAGMIVIQTIFWPRAA